MVDYDSKPLKKAGKILWHLYTQLLLANNAESINANIKTDEGEHEQLWSSPWKTGSYHRGFRSLGAGGERPNCGLKRGWHMRKSGRIKKHITWLKMQLKDLKGHLKSVLYLKSPVRGKLNPKLYVMRHLLEYLTERKNNNMYCQGYGKRERLLQWFWNCKFA